MDTRFHLASLEFGLSTVSVLLQRSSSKRDHLEYSLEFDKYKKFTKIFQRSQSASNFLCVFFAVFKVLENFFSSFFPHFSPAFCSENRKIACEVKIISVIFLLNQTWRRKNPFRFFSSRLHLSRIPLKIKKSKWLWSKCTVHFLPQSPTNWLPKLRLNFY